MHRLFVAIDLPDDVKDRLATLCSGISGAKWVGRDQMHLTLRFIGEADDSQFDQIKHVLAGIQSPPFEMKLKGAGQFPPKGKPRVIWVGVKAPPTLNALQQRVEGAIVALGHSAENRPFSAHITLARLKTPPPPEATQTYLSRHAAFNTAAFPVRSFILYSSHLSSRGATYQREADYRLNSEQA